MTTRENTIVLSQTTMDRLRDAALRRGMKSDDYAEELLTVTLAALTESEKKTKRFNASQFRGVAPTGRSAAEIDAELNAARDEWDNREQ